MYSKNVRKTSEEVRKGPASLLKISRSSVSACANQPRGFYLSGTSIPNELFQTFMELKRLVTYSKRLR